MRRCVGIWGRLGIVLYQWGLYNGGNRGNIHHFYFMGGFNHLLIDYHHFCQSHTGVILMDLDEINYEITETREKLRELRTRRDSLSLVQNKAFLDRATDFCYKYKRDWGGDELTYYGKIVSIDVTKGLLTAWELEIVDDYHFEVEVVHASVEYFLTKEEISKDEFRGHFNVFVGTIYDILNIHGIRGNE